MQSRLGSAACSTILALLGCSSASSSSSPGTGGAVVNTSSTRTNTTSAGGATGLGNGGTNGAQGGTTASLPVTGGVRATGGSVATGGKTSATGGTRGTAKTGGATSMGGSSKATGGASTTGGSSESGGTSAAGGSKNVGGTSATGGSAITGGTSAAGGTSAGAGTSATGGTTNTAGSSAGGSSPGGSTAVTLNGCTANISEATLNEEYAKWYKAYVRDCSDSVSRVQAGGSTQGSESTETFSEGIGYGMLLAASFNDEPTLKKLWAYYKSSLNDNGLMNWKMNACTGNVYDRNGASDGDLDTAMGLVMADRRWGGYSTDANTLLDAIHESETMECSGLIVLRPGDAWGLDCNTSSLNPSYFAPGYYRAFAIFQPSQAAFWNKFADDTIKLLLKYQETTDGKALMGEWSSVQSLSDKNYGYNACRTPWRVAVDYVWWGTADAKTYLTNVSAYVDSKGGVAQSSSNENSAFLGPFALSGIATGKCDAYYQSWMTGAKYDDVYFQGTLRVLAMLLMSGKFTF